VFALLHVLRHIAFVDRMSLESKMFDTWQEHLDFHYTSDSEWDNAAAYEIGAANPECAWIWTDRDVCHKNPHYVGPPVRHPDDDQEEAEKVTGPSLEECPF